MTETRIAPSKMPASLAKPVFPGLAPHRGALESIVRDLHERKVIFVVIK